ncbi:MAG TPA: hypothetical protein VNV35_06280 [Puia sp.]|nr:hypothetical protein [Puia sp.]
MPEGKEMTVSKISTWSPSGILRNIVVPPNHLEISKERDLANLPELGKFAFYYFCAMQSIEPLLDLYKLSPKEFITNRLILEALSSRDLCLQTKRLNDV